MKKSLNFKFLIILISILFIVLTSNNHNYGFSFVESKSEKIDIGILTINQLTTHDSFTITSDADFDSYDFSGTGADYDPYIIEGYNITTTMGYGIYITGTTKHFIIRDCYIKGGPTGIEIHNVAVNTSIIINNTCLDMGSFGISISNTNNATLSFNKCEKSNDSAIMIIHSDFTLLINNTLKETKAGFFVYDSNFPMFYNNSLYDCGIHFYSDNLYQLKSYYFEDNKVNGKKYGFFVDQYSLLFNSPDYGQIVLVNCSNSIISNQYIPRTATGIEVIHSNNITIQDCNIESMMLEWAFLFDGICIKESTNCTIKGNFCYNGTSGIRLEDTEDTLVTNNILEENWAGIDINGGLNTSLIGNTCERSYYAGMFLTGMDNSLIQDNTLYNNSQDGIQLHSLSNVIISYNLFEKNGYYGAALYFNVLNCKIHHNSFERNNRKGFASSQAGDYGSGNIWYDISTNEGNYWSDWGGAGPYSIEGDASSEDPYPLKNPTVPLIKEYDSSIALFFLLFIPILSVSWIFRNKRYTK